MPLGKRSYLSQEIGHFEQLIGEGSEILVLQGKVLEQLIGERHKIVVSQGKVLLFRLFVYREPSQVLSSGEH